MLETTAEALVPVSTAVSQIDTPAAPTPEPASEALTEDQSMDAIYDRLMSDGDETTDEPAAEKPKVEAKPDADDKSDGDDESEDEPETAEAEPDQSEAPTDLPASIRQHWKDVPKEAQDAILDSQRESARKLAHQGRLMQGINPIKSALETAAKEMPALMDMRPEEIAADVMRLAKISAGFKDAPVDTIMGLIQQHGLQAKIAAAFGQQAQQPQQGDTRPLQAEVLRLNNTIRQMADPAHMESQFDGFFQKRTVMDSVSQFSAKAEHWADVEPFMSDVIPLARNKLGEGASAQDVLESAYDMAIKIYLPEKADAPTAAPQAATVQNPEKAQAAIAAKSVNVISRSGTKSRPLTDDEAMDAAYDRAMRS